MPPSSDDHDRRGSPRTPPCRPRPGTCTFMPQMLAISVSGSTITQNAVSTRNVSLVRWAIADSFVSSSASTTSL